MITNYTSDLLPEKFLQKYINKEVPWGFNGLGYIFIKELTREKLKVQTKLKSGGRQLPGVLMVHKRLEQIIRQKRLKDCMT